MRFAGPLRSSLFFSLSWRTRMNMTVVVAPLPIFPVLVRLAFDALPALGGNPHLVRHQ